jgi:hypothetical protein
VSALQVLPTSSPPHSTSSSPYPSSNSLNIRPWSDRAPNPKYDNHSDTGRESTITWSLAERLFTASGTHSISQISDLLKVGRCFARQKRVLCPF